VAKLRLTLGCGDYDLLAPIIEGTVQPAGVDWTVLPMPSPERHWRMLRHEAFDVCELSMAGYLADRARRDRFVAIPVFPHRRFRHSYVLINDRSGVRTPADLNGRRIGIRTWETTAGVWIRGMLQHEYGVDLTSIEWVAQDDEDVAGTGAGRFRIRRAEGGQTVESLLLAGKLDATAYPEMFASVQQGHPAVRRLFEDYKAEELAYFKRTGIFPIMHTVVIKQSLVERFPWLPVSVMQAFETSKAEGFHRLRDPRRISLAFAMHLLEEQVREMGRDPWAYGLDANRRPLAAILQYAEDQALTPRRMAVEEIFAASALDRIPKYVG
jgi:4,5-dihydroxyphthalate decarboxylase